MTLDAAALRGHLGLPDDAAGNATAARLLVVASALVTQYATAPDAIANEAVIRTAGYLHADEPAARMLRSVDVNEAIKIEFRAAGSAVRLSGAAALLSPWRVRRAVRAEAS